jgi:RNA polymerase sigma factor (sigma-70 family)
MAQQQPAEHTNIPQVQAIKANDETAIRQLYVSNYARVEKFVLNNNGSIEQAKDIYQEAFIAVWRNIQLNRFQPQSDTALDGYLYQIAKNKWIDHLRSGHYTKMVRMENTRLPEEDATVYTEENQYISAVKKYFHHLGDNCKKILTMFYYENASMKVIAQEMGWTDATAKNNKYRCIQKLKELINQ